MTIDFATNAKKLFTKVFYRIRETTSRFVVVYGGAASSKSFSAHQNELINLISRTDGDTLVLRKHGSDLKDSCYKLFSDLIDDYQLKSLFRFTFSNANRRITYTPTGCSIVFRGVDDAEKLKSIVGIRRIMIEEASEFEFADFLEINRRARGVEDIQIIIILNPISEIHWIKTKLCDDNGPYRSDTTVIKASYVDNPFLTETDVKELMRLKDIDENQYRIYVLGEWGVEDKQKKFAWAFDRNRHVHPTTYNPEYLIYQAWDFNFNPISCTAFQHYNGAVIGLKCFKLNHSNTSELCDVIKAVYPDALFKITGDATGRAGNAYMTNENRHHYKIIQEKFELDESQFMVPGANPRIAENQILVNAVLQNVPVLLDAENCKELIYDLEYVEVDSENKILKDRSNEKRNADFLDHFRYLCNVLFPDIKKIIRK